MAPPTEKSLREGLALVAIFAVAGLALIFGDTLIFPNLSWMVAGPVVAVIVLTGLVCQLRWTAQLFRTFSDPSYPRPGDLGYQALRALVWPMVYVMCSVASALDISFHVQRTSYEEVARAYRAGELDAHITHRERYVDGVKTEVPYAITLPSKYHHISRSCRIIPPIDGLAVIRSGFGGEYVGYLYSERDPETFYRPPRGWFRPIRGAPNWYLISDG